MPFPTSSPSPLCSFMSTLLVQCQEQDDGATMPCTPEIVCDNAVTPTKLLRMQQRIQQRHSRRVSRIGRSHSENSPILSHGDEKRLQWQRQGVTSYSFQSPATTKSSWKLDEQQHESPTSVACFFLSTSSQSPKSARWNPKAVVPTPPGVDEALSPKSARWSTAHRCMLRQDSDPLLVCPARRASLRTLVPDCSV